ncbi:MAG: bacillithiol biosynthesis deacetylase BshB1 [Bacteroidetes bacterium]|nr:bacillithiol biosynthesis deacetylase BshB1 [Bacteroidota bacterium]
MKLDILVFGAHPDDAELSCGGTILKHVSLGKKVGLIDLTAGELGTRGDAETRSKEAADAAKILGVVTRENLLFADGFFQNDKEHQWKVAASIRKYKPEIILCNAVTDRHPDHPKAAKLVSDAAFLAGLLKVETTDVGNKQEPWKTKAVYHYIQDRYIKPDFVIDITEFMEKKMEAIKAYRSQFYNPDSSEPETAISSKDFLEFLHARSREFGRQVHATYAEGFTTERYPGVHSLFNLV